LKPGDYQRFPPATPLATTTLYGVTSEDVGEGGDPKAAFSDAVKRAAVHFGVGRALYALEAPWLREGEGDGQLRRNRNGRLIIDQRTEDWLRAQYARWLERNGRAQFGEPLEHGDDPGTRGFEAEANNLEEFGRVAGLSVVPPPGRLTYHRRRSLLSGE
jgi:hypothetical protein